MPVDGPGERAPRVGAVWAALVTSAYLAAGLVDTALVARLGMRSVHAGNAASAWFGRATWPLLEPFSLAVSRLPAIGMGRTEAATLVALCAYAVAAWGCGVAIDRLAVTRATSDTRRTPGSDGE